MTEPIRRPASVTVSAIVALLGSLLALFVAVMMVTTAFVEPMPAPAYPGVAITMGIVIAAFAGLGVWTSIGLLKLRAWARTSILIFSVVMLVMGVFALALSFVMPAPQVPNVDTAIVNTVRPILIGVFIVPVVIGALWVFQFSRASTKAAFASASPDADLGLPLSISIFGWTSIVGGVASLIPIILRFPAVILGVAISGWAAGVIYAVLGALSIYIGRGLLDLRERARLVCIAWYVVSVVHTGLVSFVPSLRARTAAAERLVIAQQGSPASVPPGSMSALVFVFILLIAAAAIVFLHKHRALFSRAGGPFESPPAGAA